MAEVTSGDVTVIVLSQEETEALSSVLTDWYNIMRDAVAEGEDPHGFTQQTGGLLSSVADALGVYPEWRQKAHVMTVSMRKDCGQLTVD